MELLGRCGDGSDGPQFTAAAVGSGGNTPTRVGANARNCWSCSFFGLLGGDAGFSGSVCSQQQVIASPPAEPLEVAESLWAQQQEHALWAGVPASALPWHSPLAMLAQLITVSPGTDCNSSERIKMRRASTAMAVS